MKKIYLIVCFGLALACSQKTTTPAEGKKSQKRIILHDAEDLEDQIEQKNEPFEFQKTGRDQPDRPSLSRDTVPGF